MSTLRKTLPQRRANETFSLTYWNQTFVVTVGLYPDGTPGEIFIGSGKTGGDAAAIARDAAVTLSLGLQHGVPIESIQHAVTRDSSGAPLSILGAVIDAVFKATQTEGEAA
jgi:hypothetical protein